MLSRVRALHAAAAALALVSATKTAGAWVETHVVADDVRIILERDAPARVEHRITIKVAGGPLKSIDLRGVDGDAEAEPEAYVVTERDAMLKSLTSAREVTAELLPPDGKPTKDGSPAPNVLRLRLGEKGIGRGTYVVQIRYKTRLAERGFVTRDGTVAKVRWQGVVWEDGFDSARVTFDLPGAPTPPRLDDRVTSPGGGDGPLVLSTQRRKGDRDEIELLRPYVPIGEAITWTILADARAFAPAPPSARSPADAPVISIAQPSGSGGRLGTLWLAAGAAGFFAWALLVARKVREVSLAAASAGVTPAPLVPMPLLLRAPLSAAALGLGLWLQLVRHAWTPSALALLAGLALVVHKAPAWPRAFFLRKPGRWLPVAERDAWAAPERLRGAYLDVSSLAGKLLCVLALAAVAGLSWLAAETSRHLAGMIALDATVVLALFGTGRASALPPRPVARATPLLRAISGRLAKALGERARLLGRIRIPDGATEADELRLAVVPRPAVAGFRSLETGVVIVPGSDGSIALPSVLLRYLEGSRCEAQLGALVRAGKLSRGRKPGEVAVVFTPRLPTARMTADLVARLAQALVAEPRAEPAPVPAKPRERARRAA